MPTSALGRSVFGRVFTTQFRRGTSRCAHAGYRNRNSLSTTGEQDFPVNYQGPSDELRAAERGESSGETLTVAPPILPDHVPLYRHLDPAAALAFRTPLQEHSPAADTKAAAIITALGIMLPLIARYGPALSAILWKPPAGGLGGVAALATTGATWIALLAFVGLSLGALVQAFYTFSPRMPNLPPSLAFFGDIARLSRDEYVNKVSELSHDDALKHMLCYNHNLASICVEKFVNLGKAVRYFKWAFVCWIFLMLIIGFRVLAR
jgi:hypothetical protein